MQYASSILPDLHVHAKNVLLCQVFFDRGCLHNPCVAWTHLTKIRKFENDPKNAGSTRKNAGRRPHAKARGQCRGRNHVSFSGNHVSFTGNHVSFSGTTFPLAETMFPPLRFGTCLLGARTICCRVALNLLLKSSLNRQSEILMKNCKFLKGVPPASIEIKLTVQI